MICAVNEKNCPRLAQAYSLFATAECGISRLSWTRDRPRITPQESSELLNRLTRYSGIKRSTIIEIVHMLTYGSSGQKNPDPAVQPLIMLSPSLIAISPNLLTNSSIERNFSVLLNRLPTERDGYTALSSGKEQAMISRLKAELSGLGFRF